MARTTLTLVGNILRGRRGPLPPEEPVSPAPPRGVRPPVDMPLPRPVPPTLPPPPTLSPPSPPVPPRPQVPPQELPEVPEGTEELFDQEDGLNGNGRGAIVPLSAPTGAESESNSNPTPQSVGVRQGCPPTPPLPKCPRVSTIDLVKDDRGCVIEYRCRAIGTPPPPPRRCPEPPEPPDDCEGELQEVRNRRGCLVGYLCVEPPEPPECEPGEVRVGDRCVPEEGKIECPSLAPPRCPPGQDFASPPKPIRNEDGCIVGYEFDCVPLGNGSNGNGEPPPPEPPGVFEGGDQVTVVLPEEIDCDEWPPDEQAFCWDRYGAIIEAQRRRREQIIEEATKRAAVAGGGINVGASILVGLAAYALSPAVRKQVHKAIRGLGIKR